MRIGYLYARSGIGGLWAPSLDACSQLAAAQINEAGGIAGAQVTPVYADCGFSTSKALDALDYLIEIERVDAIVGTHPSNQRDVISARIGGTLPYIYTPHYEGLACSPATLAIGSTDTELLGPALDWFHTARGADRFYFVGNDYIWPRIAQWSARRLLSRQGLVLAGEDTLGFDEPDYDEVIRRIARSGAQVVVMALLGQSAVEFNRAFAAAGLDQKCLRFGLICDEVITCAIGPEATVNLYTASRYFAGLDTHGNDRMRRDYYDAFGRYAPPICATSVSAYHGTHVLKDLAEATGSTAAEVMAASLAGRMQRRGLPLRTLAPSHVWLASGQGALLEVEACLA